MSRWFCDFSITSLEYSLPSCMAVPPKLLYDWHRSACWTEPFTVPCVVSPTAGDATEVGVSLVCHSKQFQRREDHLDLLLDRVVGVVEVQLRVLWRLVGDEMPVKFGISPSVPSCRGPWGRGLYATSSGVSTKISMNSPSSNSVLAISRSAFEAAQNHHARVDHQPRDLADPADVLDPVRVGEPEVGVQPVTQVVTVQDVGPDPACSWSFPRARWRSSTS